MNYIDGFVAAVPNAKREAYIEHSTTVAALFKEFGALRVVECWGDDVPEGKLTSFPMAVKRGEDETVVFSWIIWASREARIAGWENLMKDPRMQAMGEMPFDAQRMIYGGFEMIVDV